MTLDVSPVRFQFAAACDFCFAPGMAANTIRGAFGTILRRVAPPAEYQRIFEPRLESGPSGLADVPRPFVIRAAALDGARFASGEEFSFDVLLFGNAARHVPLFEAVFRELGAEGLGPRRGAVKLLSVSRLPVVTLSLQADASAPARVLVRFLTPTEIKLEGRLIEEPPFFALLSRIRDRVSTLRELYGDGALPIDFRALAERARVVTTTFANTHRQHRERRSTRTGQSHPLGGFTGEIEYAGDLREFLPYLRAAEWTGVGRHTVWGNGQIELAGDLTSPGGSPHTGTEGVS